MSVILIPRTVGPIPVDVVISEAPAQELHITDNPVETGADVTDHAFLKPRRLLLEVADNNAAATWAALARLQETRQPFTVVSGLSLFSNMLIHRMSAERDYRSGRILDGVVELREIILVNSSSAISFGGAASLPIPTGFGGFGNLASGILPLGGQVAGLLSTRAAIPIPSIVSGLSTAAAVAQTITRGSSPTLALAATTANTVLNKVFG